jgi:actin cytoskeleton-regulatory complex protein PAN1
MFSGSNSYLGGNAGRPTGPPQQQFNSYNQNQQPNSFPQQQNVQSGGFPANPQSGGFQPQPTGFQQPAPLQSQYTNFPGGQLQYGQNPQQDFGAPPMPLQQPPQQQQPQAQIIPQPTGFSQMAASFQTSDSKPKGRRLAKTTKIPSIRLSFITAKDQAQFETLFKSAAGDDQALSGDKSRDILLRSNLDGDSLSQIWFG